MGLDISAYRQLKARPDVPADSDDPYPLILLHAENHADFAGREAPWTKGIYECAEQFGFGCGPYSTYNRWRDSLARFAGYANGAQTAWEAASGPFWELINFSDCEGVIGSVAAAKLSKDFADHQERANAWGDEWWRGLYAKWRKAFEMAADNGAVDFH